MTKNKFKKMRLTLGMTKKELGDALGFTYRHIHAMEKGDRKINLTTELALKYVMYNNTR